MLDQLLATPTQVLLWWAALVLLVFLLFLRQPGFLTLSADDRGRLRISRHALHRLIEACCEQLQGVATARAHITRRGNRLKTVIRLKVRPNAKLDAIQGYLSQEIQEIYRQNLNFKGDVGPIEIKVIGVVPAPETF